MSQAEAAAELDGLPETVPIFPLAGALLLPRGHLPLHIFEARYRNMTRDALTAERMIGMVQPRDGVSQEAEPVIYETGCVGRIGSCSRTDDGRYYFTLTGLNRFRIARELPLIDGYRRAVADYGPYRCDRITPEDGTIDRAGVLAALRRYLDARNIDADWPAAERCSDDQLLVSLAMSCPLEPSEKQALLEAPDIAARCELMIGLLEMAGLHSESGAQVRH